MANFIPIAGTPDAAGGYLIQPEYANPLVDAVALLSAFQDFAEIERTNTRKRIYPRLVGRPTASFQDEAADGAVSGAEFGTLEINVKKMSTTLIYTEEELEDAYADPEALLGPTVEQAFSQLIDAHALGLASGAAIVTKFDADLNSLIPAGGTVEYDQTKQDALALAISAGMAWVEGNGGTPNGVALALDSRQSMRDARDAQGRPLYGAGFGPGPGQTGAPSAPTYDIPASYTTNLDGFPAGAGKVLGIGGDFTHTRFIIRRDVSVKVTAEATVNDGVADHRTFQQDKIAVKYTMRAGFNVHQGDKLFFKVTNAA